jgi:ribosomal protein L7/L12
MHDYLETILEPEFLVTLLAAFLLGRFTASGKKQNSLSPIPPTPEEIAAALKKVTLSRWMEIDAELDARKKIRAIRLLREATGLGLKDSKEAIEERERKRDLRLHWAWTGSPHRHASERSPQENARARRFAHLLRVHQV